MKKMIPLLLAVFLFLSCEFSSYQGEPSFLRFPFEKIAEFSSQTLNSFYNNVDLTFTANIGRDSGFLISAYSDTGEYYLKSWDGQNLQNLTLPPPPYDRPGYLFPLGEINRFVGFSDDGTGSFNICVYELDESTASVNVIISRDSIDFAADFSLSAGWYQPGECDFKDGVLSLLLYSDQALIEGKYSVTSTSITPAGLIHSPALQKADVLSKYFDPVYTGDTFWFSGGFLADRYRYYLEKPVSAYFLTMTDEFDQDNKLQFFVTYDGVTTEGVQMPGKYMESGFVRGFFFARIWDTDHECDYLTLYDLTGSELSSLRLNQDELKYIGEYTKDGEDFLLFRTIPNNNESDDTVVSLYALPLSYLLNEAAK